MWQGVHEYDERREKEHFISNKNAVYADFFPDVATGVILISGSVLVPISVQGLF